MRNFSAQFRFVFFFICTVIELLKRIIFLPQFSFYSHIYAYSDIVLHALFLSLNSLSILFYLQHKRAFKTRYLSAKILILFLCIRRFRHRLQCVISMPQIALYSVSFVTHESFFNAFILCQSSLCILSICWFRHPFKCDISQPKFALYSFQFAM